MEATGDFQTISVFWPVNLHHPVASLFQHSLFHAYLEIQMREWLYDRKLHQVQTPASNFRQENHSSWQLVNSEDSHGEKVSSPGFPNDWVTTILASPEIFTIYGLYHHLCWLHCCTVFVVCSIRPFSLVPQVSRPWWSACAATTDALVEKTPRFQTAFSILFTARQRLWERMHWPFFDVPQFQFL